MTTHWTPSRLGDLTGTRIIVTGATNGVGLGTARALTRAGAHVIWPSVTQPWARSARRRSVDPPR